LSPQFGLGEPSVITVQWKVVVGSSWMFLVFVVGSIVVLLFRRKIAQFFALVAVVVVGNAINCAVEACNSTHGTFWTNFKGTAGCIIPLAVILISLPKIIDLLGKKPASGGQA
jgi:hypothetical protein